MLLATSHRQDTELAMASRQPVSDEAACWGHAWHAPNCGSAHSFSLMLFCYGLALDLQSLGRGVFLLQTLLGAWSYQAKPQPLHCSGAWATA